MTRIDQLAHTSRADDAGHYEQPELWGEENLLAPTHQTQRFEAISGLIHHSSASILDLGSGDGRGLRHLREVAGHDGPLIAVDRSMSALGRQDFPRVQASGAQLPMADRSVEGVICSEVLEHLPRPIFRDCLAEMERVAADWIVISVPNREQRGRSDITCGECGCRYNPDRHLRSFDPDDLRSLFHGFRVTDMVEAGPRSPLYPRHVRLGLERAGVLRRPGSPSCPQCGERYPYTDGHTDEPTMISPPAPARTTPTRAAYDVARRLLPKTRHPYFLCARFERVIRP